MYLELEPNWQSILRTELDKPYFSQLIDSIQADYLHACPPVYPPKSLIFNAFNQCPFDQISVVILGQDPYHSPGQAMGLAFSVPEDTRVPPSLRNIYKEIRADLGGGFAAAQIGPQQTNTQNGNLTHWAKQGVLLLNTTLTVFAHQAGSHQGRGWETFTDAVIRKISTEHKHVVFMLWGTHAGQKSTLIDTGKHLILSAPHPSPLSAHRGFLGCQHFSKCNQYLKKHHRTPIVWIK